MAIYDKQPDEVSAMQDLAASHERVGLASLATGEQASVDLTGVSHQKIGVVDVADMPVSAPPKFSFGGALP